MGDIEEISIDETKQDIKKINIVGKHMIHDLLKLEKIEPGYIEGLYLDKLRGEEIKRVRGND